MKKNELRNVLLAAMFLAIGLVLPFLTGQIPEIGQMLSPLHIPVLLCGMVLGWKYGLIVGAILPILRSLIFGMPPLFPTATAMLFELAVYGLIAGLLYNALKKNVANIYVSLIGAMLAGRVVWGLFYFLVVGGFTFDKFLAGAFINAWPGIVLHIVLIPLIVLGLRKAKLMA